MNFSEKYNQFFKLLSDNPDHIAEMSPIRYVVLTGSRGSGKSFALAAWENSAMYKKGWGILSSRFTMNSAHLSIIPEYESMCHELGNAHDFTFNKTEVTNDVTGVHIDYRGLKAQSKTANSALKSVAGKNVFILEEAEECAEQPLFEKVDLSIRTKDHKNIIVIVMNPTHINHWIYKEFVAEEREDVLLIHTTYLDNYENLDQSFINIANRAKERDLKKYNHIFLGHWTTDTDGALWKDCDISPYRITQEEFNKLDIREIVVSYDPAVTDTEKADKDKAKTTGNLPDEDGLIIGAKDNNGHVYVLRDRTQRGTRLGIAEAICRYYHQHDCDWVVIEANNGGDFIPALIKTVDKYVRCKVVRATKGKKLRAQPVQAMYENGEVHHVGHFPELELEMTSWVPDSGMASPNRMDALVWLCTHLHTTSEFCFA